MFSCRQRKGSEEKEKGKEEVAIIIGTVSSMTSLSIAEVETRLHRITPEGPFPVARMSHSL